MAWHPSTTIIQTDTHKRKAQSAERKEQNKKQGVGFRVQGVELRTIDYRQLTTDHSGSLSNCETSPKLNLEYRIEDLELQKPTTREFRIEHFEISLKLDFEFQIANFKLLSTLSS